MSRILIPKAAYYWPISWKEASLTHYLKKKVKGPQTMVLRISLNRVNITGSSEVNNGQKSTELNEVYFNLLVSWHPYFFMISIGSEHLASK